MKTFRSDDLVFVDELRGQLVREVLALVGNPCVNASDLEFALARLADPFFLRDKLRCSNECSEAFSA